MDANDGRLLARATKAEGDVQLLRERLPACYEEVAAIRALVPAKIRQVDFTAPAAQPRATRSHRLFAEIACARRYRAIAR